MDLIPLQTAVINQFPQNEDKSWFVRSADGSQELGKFPATLTPKQATSYLDFARPFELNAFNIGIDFGKVEAGKVFANTEIALRSQIEFLEQQNQRLSEQLERHIIGQDEESI